MGILRLGHVDVAVVDLDLAVAYYTEVMGMLEVERDDTSVYLKCWDEPDHHSLRLVYSPRMGIELMTFKVEHSDDLSDLENAVSRYGFPVSRVSKGESVSHHTNSWMRVKRQPYCLSLSWWMSCEPLLSLMSQKRSIYGTRLFSPL